MLSWGFGVQVLGKHHFRILNAYTDNMKDKADLIFVNPVANPLAT
jgi:hypothetical protein